MPAAFKICCEKDINTVFRDLFANKACAERKNIRVVMQPAEPCRGRVMTKARADPVVPVRSDAYANARAADNDPQRGLAILQAMCDRRAEIRIVNRVRPVRPDINNRPPLFFKVSYQYLFQ